MRRVSPFLPCPAAGSGSLEKPSRLIVSGKDSIFAGKKTILAGKDSVLAGKNSVVAGNYTFRCQRLYLIKLYGKADCRI